MTSITSSRTIDRRGKTITTFVVFDADAELQTMAYGDVLELITDDFEPLQRDVAAWCRATGHFLIGSEPLTDGRRFLIEKRLTKAPEKAMAMVISDDGLEELLSPLGFALAAALEGIAVHLYIQGPAVRALARGFRPRLHGWGRPFSRFAASGLTKAGHLPAQQKLRQLRSLGARIYMCGPSMQHFKVAKEDLIFDDLPMVEYLSFMPIMADADVQLYL